MVDVSKFKEEEAGYNVIIQGRNVEVTEPIRQYVWRNLGKIEHFYTHIVDVHVTLEIQKLEHTCTMVVMYDKQKIKASASSSDMYASIDKAINRIETLIRRWKSRINSHRNRHLSEVDVLVNVLHRPYSDLEEINAFIEEESSKRRESEFVAPKVLSTETRPLKRLTLEEAMMKMDLSGDQFLLFRAEEDQKLKVIYRRKDGHYGVIQAE